MPDTAPQTRLFLEQLLHARLDPEARNWLGEACREIADGADDNRFCQLLSLASRHTSADPLAPTHGDCEQAAELLPGFTPERWDQRETARVILILSRADLGRESCEGAIEEAFRFADEGESRALYRSLAHLPKAQRFLRRAEEGCRTNMTSVFEANACDTPYPALHFDSVAWNQCLIKCVFIGSPLWRIWDVDRRLSAELTRMALDLIDERRSAGRAVQPELWMCIGTEGGERADQSIAQELREGPAVGRAAALLAMARRGASARVAELVEKEGDVLVRAIADGIARGRFSSDCFAPLRQEA